MGSPVIHNKNKFTREVVLNSHIKQQSKVKSFIFPTSPPIKRLFNKRCWKIKLFTLLWCFIWLYNKNFWLPYCWEKKFQKEKSKLPALPPPSSHQDIKWFLPNPVEGRC